MCGNFIRMNLKLLLIIIVTVFLLPILAHAEPTAVGENSTSMWSNLLWGVLPFIILALLFYWFMRRLQSSKNPRVKKYDEHVLRQMQHMERVEQILERIAKSLEKKD